mmetsp:Transcript_10557/g.24127  ORF Transcript_10557/g.24127 Transcript_10557/m.24127 type:complete len:377 (-) Transcript_10557:399-1529(-)
MAWDPNDDVAYNRPRSQARTREMIGFPLTKHQPLHVDRAAEKKRKDIEIYRNLNGGMGFSTATWMKRGLRENKENYVPFRSAGANYPPRTARGQVQNLYPGRTRPHSADVYRTKPLYTGQGEINRGPLIHFEGPLNMNVLPEEPPWDPEWPNPKDTHRPVVARLKNPPQVDGRGEKLVINGLRSMFEVQERRGNRQAARKFGEGGLFQQEGGRWLKRMWKDNAWAEPGGIKGSMRNGPTNCSDSHHPVADGFAPARIVGDGWGAKRWPQKGSHIVNSKPNSTSVVTTFGKEKRKGAPVNLRPGCWRGNCPFPHGEDGREDLVHGLPYDGVTRGLSGGRVLRLHGPHPKKPWTVGGRSRTQSTATPWAGYAAFNPYF